VLRALLAPSTSFRPGWDMNSAFNLRKGGMARGRTAEAVYIGVPAGQEATVLLNGRCLRCMHVCLSTGPSTVSGTFGALACTVYAAPLRPPYLKMSAWC
jgi:hypothetical protein